MKNLKRFTMLVLAALTFGFLSNTVFAEAVTVNSDMSMSELQSYIDSNDEITFEPGTYNTVNLYVDSAKTFYTNGEVIFKGTSEYGKEGAINDGISFKNDGSLTVASGTFILEDFQNAIYVTRAGNTELNIINGATLKLQNSISANGAGWAGNGIFVSNSSSLNINVNASKLLVDNNGGAGMVVYYTIVTMNITNNANVSLSYNGISSSVAGAGFDGIYASEATNVTISVNNSNLNLDGNAKLGIAGPHSYINLTNSNFSASNNRGTAGVNNTYVVSYNSDIKTTGNKYHGMTNISLDSYNSTIDTGENDYYGLNITMVNPESFYTVEQAQVFTTGTTNIINSTINSNDCGRTAILFASDNGTQITNSTVNALRVINENYYGIVSRGTLNANYSQITTDSIYRLYDRGTPRLSSVFMVGKGNVISVRSANRNYDINEDTATSVVARTIVMNGSFYGYRLAMQGASQFTSLNPVVYTVIEENSAYYDGKTIVNDGSNLYDAPINIYGTELTMFKLNGTGTINMFDPNASEYYDYEYLMDEVNGGAYVWAPVVAVHYDATEGQIEENGSTQSGAIEEFINTDDETQIGTSATSKEKGFEVSDYTINGTTLNTTGKTLPTASKTGFQFLGWYTASNQEKAEELASIATKSGKTKDYIALYKVLDTPFDENTKLEEEDSEITVYAKWAKVTDEITKEGPTSVDDSNDEFDYNIHYNATVEGYAKDITIIITDTLEFALNTEKSYISDDETGITLSEDYEYDVMTIYNAKDKTITWIINIKDVKASSENPLEIDINKNIKIYYDGIDNSIIEVKNIVDAEVYINDIKVEKEPTTDEVTTLIFNKGGDGEVEVLPPQTGVTSQPRNINFIYILLIISAICLGKTKLINE